MRKNLKYTLLFLTGVFTISNSVVEAGEKDVVDTAVSNGNFKILVQALKAAKLDGVLKSKGPFTVFAPNDEAFKRLPKGTIEFLLRPENKSKLVSVLSYHVVSGNVDGASAFSLKGAKTLNGGELKVAFKNAALYVDKSRVIATDIKTSNGVIHVIDSVLIPEGFSASKKGVSGKEAVSKAILEEAVDVGVDLFNAGNEKACAAIYKIAVMSVLELKPKGLDETTLKKLRNTLDAVDVSKNDRENAWSLRRAIDSIFIKLK